MISAVVGLGVACELLLGLALLVGFRARWAALGLSAYLIVLTLVCHRFWSAPADMVPWETILFFKNLTILGGLLMVAGLGPGAYSIDLRQSKAAGEPKPAAD